MNIVFMGTPEFADASLKALLNSKHQVTAVFTRQDTPKNRGMKMAMPPVKETALAAGIPVPEPFVKRVFWKRCKSLLLILLLLQPMVDSCPSLSSICPNMAASMSMHLCCPNIAVRARSTLLS